MRAAEDWLKEGPAGGSAKTVKKNENALKPIGQQARNPNCSYRTGRQQEEQAARQLGSRSFTKERIHQ